jgi:hypothetical protein
MLVNPAALTVLAAQDRGARLTSGSRHAYNM